MHDAKADHEDWCDERGATVCCMAHTLTLLVQVCRGHSLASERVENKVFCYQVKPPYFISFTSLTKLMNSVIVHFFFVG